MTFELWKLHVSFVVADAGMRIDGPVMDWQHIQGVF